MVGRCGVSKVKMSRRWAFNDIVEVDLKSSFVEFPCDKRTDQAAT
jgi:hypothetical protein